MPLAVQALLMAFDEFYFHHKRGLGKWEQIGHPLDTLTVIACLGWTLIAEPEPKAILVYLVLAAASCIFITKDEFVHARTCSGGEQWLHAVLFVGHPLCLASIGLAWPALHLGSMGLPSYLADTSHDRLPLASVLLGQFAVTVGFCFYQALYWNLLWPRRVPRRRRLPS